jgi:hypothetical protein
MQTTQTATTQGFSTSNKVGRRRWAAMIGPLVMAPLAVGCEKREASSTSGASGGAGGASAAGNSGSAGGSTAGGGGSASGGATRTYTLFWTMQKEPAGGVKIAIDVPAAWQETVDGMGGPSFRNNGLAHGPDVVLLPASGADDKARVETLVHRQYEDATLATAEREDGGDGSVWIAAKRADGYVDARRFLAAGGDSGVVVCVLTLTPAEAAKLPELKKICATLRLAP